MVNQAALRDYADEAWQQYDSFEGREVLVDPSIPILYFGDLEEYSKSKHKIVTVGLNPSDNEFPNQESEDQKRFDLVRPGEGYFDTLNEYFRKNPYRRWFRNYDKLLGGLDASYYPGKANTALHTDLCSPLATGETWGGLSDELRNELVDTGRPLWKDLINELAPDLIVASVAYEHIADLAEGERSVINMGDCEAVCVIAELVNGSPRTPPYTVLKWPYSLSSGRTVPIVYAKAMDTPLGEIGHDQKQEVGGHLAELIQK